METVTLSMEINPSFGTTQKPRRQAGLEGFYAQRANDGTTSMSSPNNIRGEKVRGHKILAALRVVISKFQRHTFALLQRAELNQVTNWPTWIGQGRLAAGGAQKQGWRDDGPVR